MAIDGEVIRAAASSPLGVLALMVLVLSIIAQAFFTKESGRIKVGIFLLMLAAVVSFGAVIIRTAGAVSDGTVGEPRAQSNPSTSATRAQAKETNAATTTVTAVGNHSTAVGTVSGNVVFND